MQIDPSLASDSSHSQRSHLEALPDEIVLYIFEMVEDTDLQTLARVSTKCRRLSSDLILWRHFQFIRNPLLVQSRLFGRSRPGRSQLIERNILKGVSAGQIERGIYINGPNMQLQHEAQIQLNRLFRQRIVREGLRDRPPVAELRNRGVMEHEQSPNVSPTLLPRMAQLKQSMKQASLNRKLRRRATISDVKESRIMNPLPVENKQETKTILERHIHRRPSVDDMERKHVLDASTCAQIICPSVRVKIDDFERRSSRFGT